MFSLTVLLIRSFKEDIPILVLTQAADSDEEPLSPPPIVFSPVWRLSTYISSLLNFNYFQP